MAGTFGGAGLPVAALDTERVGTRVLAPARGKPLFVTCAASNTYAHLVMPMPPGPGACQRDAPAPAGTQHWPQGHCLRPWHLNVIWMSIPGAGKMSHTLSDGLP